MNTVAIIMTVFSCLGALDRIFGNRLGLGKEFEKGLMLFGAIALSMIGMIVISPAAADMLHPALDWAHCVLHIEPSIITSVIFANDMGGASLATEVASDAQLGRFNGLIVASMMGCLISFTVPYAIENVKPAQHEDMLTGFLCGVVTVPVGCILSGLMMDVPAGALCADMLPLVIFSALVAAGLMFFPKVCTGIFGFLGKLLRALITLGLMLSIITYLTGFEPIKGLRALDEAAGICVNASVVMTGAFPMLFIISKLFRKPLEKLGARIGINETSAAGFVSTLASSTTTFEMMARMDPRGVALNSAFCVSAAFVLADHLAFTLAFDSAWLPGVIAGKLISGILAVLLANFMYNRLRGHEKKPAPEEV